MSDELWNFITTGRDDLANVLGQAFPQDIAQKPYEPEMVPEPEPQREMEM